MDGHGLEVSIVRDVRDTTDGEQAALDRLLLGGAAERKAEDGGDGAVFEAGDICISTYTIIFPVGATPYIEKTTDV